MSNDDIENDLDVENFDDSGFDSYSNKGTLGDMWRNNPMVKIGVILAAFAVVVGAIILFGGSKKPENLSRVADTSDVTEVPGAAPVSETMKNSIEEKNIDTLENASRTGGSAVPMPVDTVKGTVPLQNDDNSGEDPLERWRRMQEERVRQQEAIAQAKPAKEQAPPVDTRTPAVNAMSQSMQSQMQAVLQNQKIGKVQTKQITDVSYLEQLEEKKLKKFQDQQRLIQQNGQYGGNNQTENIFLPAGTIEYGQLLIEANTDAPGPVMAQIVSGPLKGSRVIGNFQSTDKYITLNFRTIVIDGIDYPIEAVAVDPNTTLPGMVTEIDHRYFERVVLPMAAEFVQGLAQAVSDSGTTTVVIEGGSVAQSTSDKNNKQEVASGIDAAGDKLADILNDEADDIKPMLRIASGTPIGVFFLRPVTDLAQTDTESRKY